MIRAVYFDVGETLVDETRQWGMWADWIGVPRLTFFAVLGALIARGEHHRCVFDHFVPGFDIAQATRDRDIAGEQYRIERQDLYPDAIPCLAARRAQGQMIGIAGNQPEEAESALRSAGVPADHMASSARWCVEKPSLKFFENIIAQCAVAPDEIAYVGDRIDNDILPAKSIGMMAIFIERGPWGAISCCMPGARACRCRFALAG